MIKYEVLENKDRKSEFLTERIVGKLQEGESQNSDVELDFESMSQWKKTVKITKHHISVRLSKTGHLRHHI